MYRAISFGIPSLDGLISDEEPKDEDLGIRMHRYDATSSICILGPDGTGKSVFGLHLAASYRANCTGDCDLPKVLYISTDLTHEMADKMWLNFGLDRPRSRRVPFKAGWTIEGDRSFVNVEGGVMPRADGGDLKVILKERLPGALSEYLAAAEVGDGRVVEVTFVDLSSATAGDDWGFLNRILSVLEKPRPGQPRHMVIVDAVEGFETLVGEQDAYGETRSRRSRIAQIMRSISHKCHITFIVEEPEEGMHLPEEFVSDVVIRLRSVQVKNYARRTVEIEKARGQSHVRGQHPYVIRSGEGSMTGRKPNWDDPRVPPPRPSATPDEDGTPREYPETQSYVHVFHSLHRSSRHMMSVKTALGQRPSGERPDMRDQLPEPRYGHAKYAAFGIPYLDEMLAGTAERVTQRDGYDTRGLPCGTITALIGDSATQKSQLGTAFLCRAFKSFADRLFAVCTELRKFQSGGELTAVRGALKDLWLSRWVACRPDRAAAAPTQPGEEMLREFDGSDACKEFQSAFDKLGRGEWAGFVEHLGSATRGVPPGREFRRLGDHSPRDISRLGAWLLAQSNAGRDGVAVLLTMRNRNSESLTRNFLHWMPEVAERDKEFPGYAEFLRQHMERYTVCRRLELHDLPSAVLFHIVQRTIEAAQNLLFDNATPQNHDRRSDGSWPIRVVIDDFSTFRDTFPELREDTLLLPFILFSLAREGVTTLVVDTQSGKPDTPVSERFESELRTLAHQCLYTWRLPFYGESRIAISAIPPIAPHMPAAVRELRGGAHEESEPPSVDPHFELYTGLEEGKPEPVPLEIRLFKETPAFARYIEQENVLYRELFTPATPASVGDVIIGEAPTEHDSMRDFCFLQRDTRLNHAAVLQVDEFWGVRYTGQRRTGAFRPQWGYLNAITNDNGAQDSAVDPFGLFQATGNPRASRAAGRVRRRRDYFEPVGYKLDQEERDYIDRVPFMWDFGFLLCKARPWAEAEASERPLPLLERHLSRSVTVGDVWQALPKAKHDEPKPLPPGSRDDGAWRTSWRAFLEACKEVAKEQTYKTSAPAIAFDLAMGTPESLSCLILELWASEIYDRLAAADAHNADGSKKAHAFRISVSERRWRPAPQGLVEWLAEDQPLVKAYRVGGKPILKGYSLELYKAWLLLVDTLDLKELLDHTHAFDFRVRDVHPSAITARHWYKTASTYIDACSPSDQIVATRMPGHFSVRGDWFLTVAGGSRSSRLADRALDLLSSRRGNINRLQMGLGLPTRDLVPASEYPHLDTRLFSHDLQGMLSNISYAELRKIGAPAEGSPESRCRFSWFWRSRLCYYHRHTRIWQKWLNRMVLTWNKLRADQGDNWVSGFQLYDEISRGDFERVTSMDSWEQFAQHCDILLAELRQSSPEQNHFRE